MDHKEYFTFLLLMNNFTCVSVKEGKERDYGKAALPVVRNMTILGRLEKNKAKMQMLYIKA